MVCDKEPFICYLEAKKSIDDRSLNHHVLRAMKDALDRFFGDNEIQVLEAGCGVGSMIERMISWGCLNHGSYTAVDILPQCLQEAARNVAGFSRQECMEVHSQPPNTLTLIDQRRRIGIEFVSADVLDFARKFLPKGCYHLVLAHAFFDLVNMDVVLPSLLSLLRPGGLAYFTLNFDGVTSLEPPWDKNVDERIVAIYHESMDRRMVRGQPSGDSTTGRHLLVRLHASGLAIIDAGPSDWVVFPRNGAYSSGEAYFLHFIVDTIYHATKSHPDLNPKQLNAWREDRHHRIEQGELFYVAHQLDVLSQKPQRSHVDGK
jgi:SAM-dependent methyltransferase